MVIHHNSMVRFRNSERNSRWSTATSHFRTSIQCSYCNYYTTFVLAYAQRFQIIKFFFSVGSLKWPRLITNVIDNFRNGCCHNLMAAVWLESPPVLAKLFMTWPSINIVKTYSERRISSALSPLHVIIIGIYFIYHRNLVSLHMEDVKNK
jgi:hypothetical protein